MSNFSFAAKSGRQCLGEYLPVYMASLRTESVLNFDLYHFNGQDMILFRAAHQPFTPKVRELLMERNIMRLYVPSSQRRLFQSYVQSNIRVILDDEEIDEFTKASIVYDSAKQLMSDVFENPTHGENIRQSQAFVEATVMYVLQGPNTLHNMLRVMSFDYTLYTHSVNVCTFSLALANAIGIEKNSELIQLGTGSLLHDVGKVKVPDTILHKPGPLDPGEFETIRQHPLWGVELVSGAGLLTPETFIPIKQHHERQDGAGYPARLKASDIHLYGRIVAIADAFDAMTTNRVYAEARSAYDTLKVMFEDKHGFDEELLRTFTKLLGPHGNSSR
jgi:HD-GYP domain-containing protein (c-di-GMP phosphodiesterase class II)